MRIQVHFLQQDANIFIRLSKIQSMHSQHMWKSQTNVDTSWKFVTSFSSTEKNKENVLTEEKNTE